MSRKYILVVRDAISTRKACTDNDLKCLDCYYESPEFLWDGTFASLNALIDRFYENFRHFRSWRAELVAVA